MDNDLATNAMIGRHLVQAAFGGSDIILNFYPEASINACSYDLFVGAKDPIDVHSAIRPLFDQAVSSVEIGSKEIKFRFSGNHILAFHRKVAHGESIVIENEMGISIY